MELGAFSISLTVKDIHASVAFYEKLGFKGHEACDPSQGWTMMKNGDTVIGLFQGMFEKNMLTFNPGWNQSAVPLDEFTDVRDLKIACQSQGLEIHQEQASGETGPASFVLIDPDGNPILIDQHR